MITIIQNGKVGDIIRLLPAAKYLADQGNKVFWQCDTEYHSLFDYVDYVRPVSKPPIGSHIIDTNFGINQHTRLHREWIRRRPHLDSFLTFKYELLGAPISEVSNLVYNRDIAKENELCERLSDDMNYILVHLNSTYGTPINEGELRQDIAKIHFRKIGSFSIFDWRKVIEDATEIHCIDSSLVNFVDCLPHVSGSLHYYITDKVPMKADRTILNKEWNTINKLEYVNS